MPRPWEMGQKFDLVTADFAHVRWLGDRKRIEEQTATWDKTVVERTSDLKHWVDLLKEMVNNKKNSEAIRVREQPLRRAWARDGQTGHGFVEPGTIDWVSERKFHLSGYATQKDIGVGGDNPISYLLG